MTLRATQKDQEAVVENATTVQDTIKVTKFLQTTGDTMEYLMHDLDTFSDNKRIVGIPLVLVEDATQHLYLKALCDEWYGEIESSFMPPLNGRRIDSCWWSQFNIEDKANPRKLKKLIEEICKAETITLWREGLGINRLTSVDTTLLRHIIIFWNLFFAAMDDDLYDKQLSAVTDLAQCFGFDEPMIRDWCRAVEYVFAGNKLSEDCDLHCETVEGAKFFLHKEE